ncbi:LysM peptidoglycan-binding domain-containing protein [Chloroflexi bacterium TSY]|nr:LysM peptidoglycan-binding domain-containing protein [Chloroflexi bacterium TSY]
MKQDNTFEYLHRQTFNCRFPSYLPIDDMEEEAMFLRREPWPNPDEICTLETAESYEVRAGDTLIGIAQKFCGDWTLYTRIQSFNENIRNIDPKTLQVETILNIPPEC